MRHGVKAWQQLPSRVARPEAVISGYLRLLPVNRAWPPTFNGLREGNE